MKIGAAMTSIFEETDPKGCLFFCLISYDKHKVKLLERSHPPSSYLLIQHHFQFFNEPLVRLHHIMNNRCD